MKVCKVLIEHGFLDQQFFHYTYEGFELKPFVRVRVPFAAREIVGIVWELEQVNVTSLDYQLKNIIEVLDQEALFDEPMNQLANWLAQRTCAPLIMAYQTILPNKIKPSSATKAAKQAKVYRFIQFDDQETTKGKETLTYLSKHPYLLASEFKNSTAIMKRLESKGLITSDYIDVVYQQKQFQSQQASYTLNKAQQNCVDAITLGQHQVSLIHGVTGSGKTEVYMKLCEQVLERQQQALIMVPEIALTPQMIDRFQQRFGLDVGVYHSALNDQEKYEQYQRIKHQEVQIVIGTRSSIFLPFTNLGLVVLDEEHDTSYKNGTMPYYHARDVAIYRGEQFSCPVVLGSASPSFESYARALRGVYQWLEMPQRVYEKMPVVHLVDMHAKQNKQSRWLSDDLIQGVSQALEKDEQIILLLNRRGYHTLVKCNQCNEVICCPHCDVALTYHKETQLYQCHTCGYQAQEVFCAKGHQGQLVGSGIGTQRLQEECARLFPYARVERFDYDTTRRKNGHQKILERFEKKEIDILIGTQMIAKGIDVSSVTQVGILSADATLMREDYRSSEMTFDLLLQASGRSGRGEKPGRVVIQTYNGEHYAIQSALKQDYKRFFAYEMKYRKLAQYPPYTYLISITLQDLKEDKVDQYAAILHDQFHPQDSIKILGPAKLLKRADFYRTRYIMKGKELDQMIHEVQNFLEEHPNFRSRIRCLIDVNPMILEA